LCVDFGSTFTKAALFDPADGSLLAQPSVPTTASTDVDSACLLFAAGLLADAPGHGPDEAAKVAVRLLAAH
jgi:sugar (pentulose or hexulose) kinase